MADKVLLAPTFDSEDILIEYSKPVKLDKNVYITVPSDYIAYFASDEVYVAKISNCKEASLLKIVGKDFYHTEVKIAFIKNIKLPLEPWGFGEIRVVSEKLHLTYNVGCNGKYQLQITNPNRLLRAFSNHKSVSIKMIKEKTKPLLEPVARPIISKYFVEHQLDAFEIDSKLDEIRNALSKALTKEDLFKDYGLKIKEITINGIYIPDSDMEKIKEAVSRNDNGDSIDETLEEIRKEIDNVKKSLKDMYDTDTVIEEIDNLRRELLQALHLKDREEALLLEQELNELQSEINKEDK